MIMSQLRLSHQISHQEWIQNYTSLQENFQLSLKNNPKHFSIHCQSCGSHHFMIPSFIVCTFAPPTTTIHSTFQTSEKPSTKHRYSELRSPDEMHTPLWRFGWWSMWWWNTLTPGQQTATTWGTMASRDPRLPTLKDPCQSTYKGTCG